MHIWLITVGEPLPIDKGNIRLYRTGIVANLLVKRGHSVVWWTSTLDHIKKRQRFRKDTFIDIDNNYKLILLHSNTYKKNISIRRIINHRGTARKFYKYARIESPPDIILCSFPTIELSYMATKYGEKNFLPVVLDARDMWPDIFIDVVPSYLRGVMRLLLFPMFNKTERAFSKAFSVIGITHPFLEWGLNHANREETELDNYFPLGYSDDIPDTEKLKSAEIFWKKYGLYNDNRAFVICFIGYMGHQFELDTVIETARKIKKQGKNIIFVLCGTGDKFNYYKELAKGYDNIILPGWVGSAEIWKLMRFSSVGLAPYCSTEDFMASYPNKSIEYLSAGLPIVSSLKGMLEGLLDENNCGITYENNNPGELMAKIIYLKDNPDILSKMSENALSLFKEKFVAKKVYNSMIQYLEFICNIFSEKNKLKKNE